MAVIASLLTSLPEHRFRKYDVSTPTFSLLNQVMGTKGDFVKSPGTFFQKSFTVITAKQCGGNDGQQKCRDAKRRQPAPLQDERLQCAGGACLSLAKAGSSWALGRVFGQSGGGGGGR